MTLVAAFAAALALGAVRAEVGVSADAEDGLAAADAVVKRGASIGAIRWRDGGDLRGTVSLRHGRVHVLAGGLRVHTLAGAASGVRPRAATTPRWRTGPAVSPSTSLQAAPGLALSLPAYGLAVGAVRFQGGAWLVRVSRPRRPTAGVVGEVMLAGGARARVVTGALGWTSRRHGLVAEVERADATVTRLVARTALGRARVRVGWRDGFPAGGHPALGEAGPEWTVRVDVDQVRMVHAVTRSMSTSRRRLSLAAWTRRGGRRWDGRLTLSMPRDPPTAGVTTLSAAGTVQARLPTGARVRLRLTGRARSSGRLEGGVDIGIDADLGPVHLAIRRTAAIEAGTLTAASVGGRGPVPLWVVPDAPLTSVRLRAGPIGVDLVFSSDRLRGGIRLRRP